MSDADEGGLSIDVAASTCGVSRDTIKRRLAAGAFPNATRTRGPGPKGPWRIPQIDLRASGLLVDRPLDEGRGGDHDLRVQLAIAQTRVQELRRQVELLRSLLDVSRA